MIFDFEGHSNVSFATFIFLAKPPIAMFCWGFFSTNFQFRYGQSTLVGCCCVLCTDPKNIMGVDFIQDADGPSWLDYIFPNFFVELLETLAEIPSKYCFRMDTAILQGHPHRIVLFKMVFISWLGLEFKIQFGSSDDSYLN